MGVDRPDRTTKITPPTSLMASRTSGAASANPSALANELHKARPKAGQTKFVGVNVQTWR